MSVVMTFSYPMARAECRDPMTPATGPESRVRRGERRATSTGMVPPAAWVIWSGARYPACVRRASMSAR